AGRCYESESLPFKGVDALVDALAQHLRRIPDALPSPSSPLLRLFPALRPAESDAPLPAVSPAESDAPPLEEPAAPAPPDELRRLAFAQLAELLRRLRGDGPVVLFIDDFQWADEDSLVLISEVLLGSEAPPVLWILAHRADDWELANRLWQRLQLPGRSKPV